MFFRVNNCIFMVRLNVCYGNESARYFGCVKLEKFK